MSSVEAPGANALGQWSYTAPTGTRIDLSDLEIAVVSASKFEVERLRADSLGFERVVTNVNGPDGYEVHVHLYWLPAELVSNEVVQIGRMALDWLKGADAVVYVARGDADAADNASGLEDLRTWHAKFEPDSKVVILQVDYDDRVDAQRGLAIQQSLGLASIPMVTTCAALGTGVDELAARLQNEIETILAAAGT